MLIKTRWVSVGLAVLLSSAAIGCGGDDDDDDNATGSGAPDGKSGNGAAGQGSAALPAGTAGKKLSELSPDEAVKTCEAIAKQASAAISDDEAARLACTLLAVLLNGQAGADGKFTVDATKCKQSVAECMKQGGGTATEQYDCDPTQMPAQFKDCAATASELSACADASIAATKMLLDQVSCDNVSSAAPAGAAFGMEPTPPACATLQMKCPGLDLGGDSDLGTGMTQAPSPTGCDDTCEDAKDDFCDDGGPNSDSSFCGLGTDCTDCGMREKP